MPPQLITRAISRIEGHGRLLIELDEAGNVAKARLQVLELRGFEKLLEGRPAEEVPRIVSRICGICPWMHHVASAKAVEACFGLTPPPAARMLTELMFTLAHAADHILHIFLMALPDFLELPQPRGILGLVNAHPRVARSAAKARALAQSLIEEFSGRAVHPVAVVPGGFCRSMDEPTRNQMLAGAKQLLELVTEGWQFLRANVLPKLQELAPQEELTTGFLGMVSPGEGALELFEGMLRLMHPQGGITDFPYEQYSEYLGEHVEPWTHGKFPYARIWGEGFSLQPPNPRGLYRTNALARINVCDFIPTPLAQKELELLRQRFGRPIHYSFFYHWARAIELLFCCERTIQLLENPRITSKDVRVEAIPRAGRGIGCVEAPRGTLIHDYTTDEQGFITRANLIVGTTHNLGPINASIQALATKVVRHGKLDEHALHQVEMIVRAYDP